MVLLAIFGPFIVYAVLLGHVIFNHFVQTPGPLEIQNWDKSMSSDVKDAIIASRQEFIEDLTKEVSAKGNPEEFAQKWLTEDAEVEDPFDRLLYFVDLYVALKYNYFFNDLGSRERRTFSFS